MTEVMKNKLPRYTATLLKLFLGAFFVFSALAKFVSIDLLNIYIYSFGIFSLNLSIVAAWLLISLELLLGVALMANKYHKWVCMANLMLLVAFTLFLGYAQLVGRTDNCHCLGELLPFSPVESMLKNAVLIVLLLVVWKYADPQMRIRWWVPLSIMALLIGLMYLSGRRGWVHMTLIDFQYCATLVACMAVVGVVFTTKLGNKLWLQGLLALVPVVAIFVLSVAAGWLHKSNTNMVNEAKLTEAITDDAQLGCAGLGKGRKVLCLFSRTCGYCRIASQKITMIQHRNDLPAEAIVTAFPGEDTVGIAAFYQNGAQRYQEYLIDPTSSVMITYGQFPTVVLLEDGKVQAAYGHGDISESRIVNFLKK